MLQVGTFGAGNIDKKSIFSEFQNSAHQIKASQDKVGADTIEISKKAIKKPQINKKLLVGAAIVIGGVMAVVALGKNLPKILTIVKKQDELAKQGIDDARRSLISDVEAKIGPEVNGVCFHGPNSKAKEQAISGFIGELSNAGYDIQYVPRANEAELDIIGTKLSSIIEGAKELFKKDNKRTAVVIRDLDQLAPNNIKEATTITGILKRETESAKEKGFVLVSEAVDIKNVDSAVRRVGRMDTKVFVRPLKSDSIMSHKEYIELLASKLNR